VVRGEIELPAFRFSASGIPDHSANPARLTPRAGLVLYPDAGHEFLFQEGTRLASLIESFLAGHPSS
jgi:hypothetical protein